MKIVVILKDCSGFSEGEKRFVGELRYKFYLLIFFSNIMYW